LEEAESLGNPFVQGLLRKPMLGLAISATYSPIFGTYESILGTYWGDKWQVSDAVSVCLPVEIIPIKGSVAVPRWDCDVPTMGLL